MTHAELDDAFINGRSQTKTVAVDNTADRVVASQNEKRVSITFISCVGTQYLNTVAMTATGQGGALALGSPIKFNQRLDGDLATKEWHCFGSGASQLIMVVEVLACPCATGHPR